MVNLELEFVSKQCPCLRWNLREVQQQEQTQELRLPEGMPDIGRILGTWGQCIIRGKDWHSEEIGVSGGVMVWVLYLPAEGGEPQSVEGWLPLHPKWSQSDSHREGTIRTDWKLKDADARMLSARKMMIRVNVEALAEALEPMEATVFTPGEVPENVYLLRREYPVMVPREAGEKTFQIEQSFSVPQGSPAPEQLIYCRAMPQITEQKVVGGRVVFKGVVKCHLLYRARGGELHPWDTELNFSQFEDLEQTLSQEAQLSVMPALTSLEPELQEGQLLLKAGLAAQYIAYDRQLMELVEDAYSPRMELTVHTEPVNVEILLDASRRQVQPQVTVGGQKLVDATVYTDQPRVELGNQELSGRVRCLMYDEEGNLEAVDLPWQEQWDLEADGKVGIQAQVTMDNGLKISGNPGQYWITPELEVQTQFIAPLDASMVTGVSLGQPRNPDPHRPSLVLKRPGSATLWELAKASGSTVEAICQANHLSGDPIEDRLLLIPIQ